MLDLRYFKVTIVGLGCLGLGYCIGLYRPDLVSLVSTKVTKVAQFINANKKTNESPKGPLKIEKLADVLDDFKMVLVVRADLKMGKGEIAARCSQATIGLYNKLLHQAPKCLKRWEMCAQPKVVVKTESEEDLLLLQEKAKLLNLPTYITIEERRTQISPDSRTVMAILGPVGVVNDVTGGLKLL